MAPGLPTRLAILLLLIAGCAPAHSFAPRPLPPTAPAAAPTPTRSEDRPAEVSLLFVGNSHTGNHDLPGLVRDLIRFHDPAKSVYSEYVPVGFLDEVATRPASRAALEARRWTAIVLQAQKISQSGRHEYPRSEGIEFARLAKGRGAAVVFYPEWGLSGVAGDGARQEKVYREMAKAAGVGVAPVARAWDLALADRPDLPLYADDGNHQSALGAFLTACVLYGRLTGDSPVSLADYPHPAADQRQRRFLAAVAARALAEREPDP